MKLAALFSGGKDSAYSSHLMEIEGDQIEYLVSVEPLVDDSYMYHSINVHVTKLQAQAINKKHIITKSKGKKESELTDLKIVLGDLNVEGVVSGAIASNYQKTRIDLICEELDLLHFSPLWGKCRLNLLNEMISENMIIMITAVAALGFDESWLGKLLNRETVAKLQVLNHKYGVDLGGRRIIKKTLVLDAPWFNRKIKVLDATLEWDTLRGSYLINKAKLVEKT
jgi:ABC transporter with metal-binding/Fe-S-binding domain ATP-binding protein